MGKEEEKEEKNIRDEDFGPMDKVCTKEDLRRRKEEVLRKPLP